jgi:tripartite-type tricarboxylate transporter receptor subunit TctC
MTKEDNELLTRVTGDAPMGRMMRQYWWIPAALSEKLVADCLTGPAGVPFQPQVQTLDEVGITGFEGYNWIGLFAPAGTPPEVIRKISADINQVNADPAVQKRLVEGELAQPARITPEEFRKIYDEDYATWARVIKSTGVTLDP